MSYLDWKRGRLVVNEGGWGLGICLLLDVGSIQIWFNATRLVGWNWRT